MGELGWSLEKWKDGTFIELNYAVSGYWRNWERFAALPMREICYVNIAGNPNIKQSSKPRRSSDFMKLSIDGERKIEKPTEEEIKKAQQEAFEYGKK